MIRGKAFATEGAVPDVAAAAAVLEVAAVQVQVTVWHRRLQVQATVRQRLAGLDREQQQDRPKHDK